MQGAKRGDFVSCSTVTSRMVSLCREYSEPWGFHGEHLRGFGTTIAMGEKSALNSSPYQKVRNCVSPSDMMVKAPIHHGNFPKDQKQHHCTGSCPRRTGEHELSQNQRSHRFAPEGRALIASVAQDPQRDVLSRPKLDAGAKRAHRYSRQS